MNTQDVQDVDFKEVTKSQMLDGNTQQPSKPRHRILHVQVGGNPSTDDLKTIADSFQKSLEANSTSTVTTTGNVQCFNIYEEGEAPFNGVLVRGAITLADIARTIHDAELASLAHGFKHWYDITDEQRGVYLKYVRDELRGIKHQFKSTNDDWNVTKERLISAVVTALKPCLPAPQLSNLVKTQVWNGGADITADGSWADVDFTGLKQGQVWRATGVTPAVYRHNVTDSYVNYEGGTSFVTVDCVEVLPVAGDADGSTGWKLKSVVEAEQKAAEEAIAKEDAAALAQAEEARSEGFATQDEVREMLEAMPELSEEDSAPAGEEVLEPFNKVEGDASESQDQ